MARRRGAVQGFPARKLVNYTWSGLVQGSPVTVPAASKVLLSQFFLATAFEETIVRTRGVFTIVSDQEAADEQQVGALGFMRVTDEAITAGAASIPGPVTNADDDGWFVWVPFVRQLRAGIGLGPWMTNFMIDSKAQRIVREGQQVAVMVENASSSHGLTIQVALRVLSRFRS